jgi:glutathione S-transferase
MIKLYHSPGACSLVPHIALEEAGADYEPVPIVLAKGEQLTPDFLAINPHARVPALGTDQGVITENVAVLNFIADQFRGEGSVPRGDAFAAAKCNELLAWFATNVHIGFAQVWRASRFSSDESLWPGIEAGGRASLARQFAEIESLAGDGWLVAGHFTGADGYALTFFRWGKRIGHDMTVYPRWRALAERALQRPAVRRTVELEGFDPDSFLDPQMAPPSR